MQNLLNLLKVKSLITLAVIAALCFLVLTNPDSDTYSSAFIGIASSVATYYFNKSSSDGTEG